MFPTLLPARKVGTQPLPREGGPTQPGGIPGAGPAPAIWEDILLSPRSFSSGISVLDELILRLQRLHMPNPENMKGGLYM